MATQTTSQPQPDTAAQVAATLAAYQAAALAMRQRTLAILATQWQQLGSWRSADFDRFIQQALPIVQAGQRQIASLTVAQLAMIARTAGHDITAPGLTAFRAVDPAVEYRRPFITTWTALSDGRSLQEAVDAGAKRLESLAATDLQLAKTKTAQAALTDASGVTGYRRVLEGVYSCGLCIVAATRRYHKAELLPIHPGCDCSIEPLYGQHPNVLQPTVRDAQGNLVPVGDLEDAHQAIADRFGADSTAARAIQGAFNDSGAAVLYRDVLIIHQHGEIGPVLAVRGQAFTGPADI